jgi:tetratricopeptide (TPR) repeat protein
MRVMWISALLAAALWGQGVESRIEQAPLAPEVRETVLKSLAARDYLTIESLLAASPSGQIQALLGAIEFVGGRVQQAASAFGRADGILPLDDRDRFTFAMAFANLGDNKSARAQLDKLLEHRPDQPLYLYWVGRLDYYQRRYEDAVATLNKVVKLDPGSARAWDSLGLAYDMMGESNNAEQAFARAVELNRKLQTPSPWPPMNYGALLFRVRKLPEAEANLREALRLEAGFAQAHYYLGRVLEQSGKDAEATTELLSATRLAPAMPEPWYTLGLLYRRQGRTEEAGKALAEYKKRRDSAPGTPGPAERQSQ